MYFAILINGVDSPFFHSHRGILQGCPLSPLLFLLVVEGLSHYLSIAKYEGSFGGIQISQELSISHLLFADDILIFYDGSQRDTNCLVAGLELFKKATWMLINDTKSSLVSNLVLDLYMVTMFPFLSHNFDDGLK